MFGLKIPHYKKIVPAIILFALSLGLFLYIQWEGTFADPDSFYHLKTAQLMYEQGIFEEFPYLSATSLRTSFTNHHFLYHVLLMPFVVIGDLVGMKVASIFFASLLIVSVYGFLRLQRISGAFWYAFFLLSINPFIFRINLAKAQPLVMALLFVLLFCLFRRKYVGVALLSAAYVLMYGGWVLLPALAVWYVLVSIIFLLMRPKYALFGVRKNIKQSLLLLLSVATGIIAGLVLNPYFPQNIWFYWQQSILIALVNYQDAIPVGGEWYPYLLKDLLLVAPHLFALVTGAVVAFIFSLKKQSAQSWFLGFVTVVFFVLTLKSRRYVEYFVPFGVVFSAFSFHYFWLHYKHSLRKLFKKPIAAVVMAVLMAAVGPQLYFTATAVKRDFIRGLPFTKFLTESKWLEKNTNQGDIIFHSDWDEFPLLYYHNHHNYYIVGLDPTFLYTTNKDAYLKWYDVTTGKETTSLYDIIRGTFGASYVLVDYNRHKTLDRNIQNNFYFERVYEGPNARIYRVN